LQSIIVIFFPFFLALTFTLIVISPCREFSKGTACGSLQLNASAQLLPLKTWEEGYLGGRSFALDQPAFGYFQLLLQCIRADFQIP